MGQLIISAAAATAGYMIGGPTGAQIGWAIGSAVSAPKIPGQHSAQPIMDLKVTGTEYGQPIPYVRGAAAIAGQVWWNTDRRPTTTTVVTEAPGKGGGAEDSTSSTTTYDMDMLIGLANNEIAGIARIWKNGELVYTADSGATSGSLYASSVAGQWTRLTVYTGSASQLPDPTYEAAVGAANAPAYRGRAYVFIEGLKLGQSGQVPNLTFEVVADGAIVPGGTTWTSRSTPEDNTWRSVAYGNGIFVALSQSATGNVVMTSPDAINWTIQTSVAPANNWSCLAFGNGIFVAVSTTTQFSQNPVMTSSDGVTWTITQSGVISQFFGITYGNGLFVAVSFNKGAGSDNYVMTSPDGVTWTARTSASTNAWRSVTYGNGLFVAVAESGTGNRVMTSPDGITWTSRTSAADNTWYSVAFGNGVFVAVSTDGASRVMTSPDGINWTSRTAASSNTWRYVAFGGGMFVAVATSGTGNRVMTSPDGITWTSRTSAADIEWTGIGYGAGLFVAVSISGSGNQVMTSTGIESISAAPPAVSSVVSALCLRGGLTAGQIDVTGLSTITRTVRSMALSQIASTRQALELLASTYFFEMVTSDKIYFRPRGGASVATIPYLDLGASMGDDQPEPLALRQINELEIPAQIALSYINVSDDYQTDTQYSDRLISATSGTVNTVQMAIGMTPAEAKAVADTMLLDQAASVISTPIALLGNYCRLEPTDPVTVTGADGSTFRLRLVKKTDSYPLLKFDAVLDDTSVLSSQGITSTDYTSSTVVAAATGTLMELLDIPILQDADDDAGFYVAAKGDAANYPGSAIFGSNDNVEYTRKATVLESAVFGTCTTTLGDWTGPRVFDEMNSVTVNVGDGTLASSTRDAILNSLSVNAMLVGSEMIQFHTATLVSAGVYTLTGLLRGGRGTEWAMVDHAVNERCVLLRGAGLRRIIQQNNDISLEKYYKGVTLGRTLSSATAETFTNNAVGLKPFSPFDLRATRSASGTVFTMQRRTRLAVRTIGPLGISIPLGEDEASYTLEIYDVAGYTTLKRTLTSTTLSFSYAAADEITDFGSQQATYYCRAYQRSQQVGLGYKLQAAA